MRDHHARRRSYSTHHRARLNRPDSRGVELHQQHPWLGCRRGQVKHYPSCKANAKHHKPQPHSACHGHLCIHVRRGCARTVRSGWGETQVTSYPGIFVGSWFGQGRQLVVNANGSTKATYRAYVFCSQNPTPPCDQMISSQIVAGGQVTLHVGQVVTANHMSTATAIVLTSSDPKIAPGSTQTLVLNGDVITWTKFDTFCDSKAEQSGTCGA